MTSICVAVHGLAVALHYTCHTLGIAAGIDFLEAIRDQLGPLAEGAVLVDFTAAAFTQIGRTP